MGCQYGQGYLLSVPVEATKAEALLSLGHGLAPELPRQRRKPPDHSYLTDLNAPAATARRSTRRRW